MRKLTFLLACLLLVGVGLVQAQSKSISGKVLSADDGQPIIGATVFVKGTSVGTITNSEGSFKISLQGNATNLLFSYVGMKTLDVVAKNDMVVSLETDALVIDEVMVVAYGSAKKSAFTGSASVIKADKISQRSVSNVTNALAGQVAGVQITSSNGQPGTSATVRIRGIGSMSASNSPLYVVDGVPYDGSLSAINPQDIESMTVLKDAAANAIYGSRGANGVILITTKKADSKESTITVDAKWGSNSRSIPNYDVMTDPGMYYETYYKALYNSRINAGKTPAAALTYADATLTAKAGLGYQVYTIPAGEKMIGTDFKLNPNAKLGYSDGKYFYTPDNWYNELFDKGNMRQEYNVSVSGASDKLSYYMSAGYLDDSGIISGSGFSRYTGRAKVDYDAKKWLKIGTNLAYTNYDIQSPGSQTSWGSSGNAFYVSNMISPIYPMYVRNPDGTIKVDSRGTTVYDFGGSSTNCTRAFMPLANPAITLQLDKNHAYTDVVNAKWYAIVTPFEGMQVTANIGANVTNQRSNSLNNQYYGGSVGTEGYVSVSHYRQLGLNQQYLATYKKTIGVNNFDLMAGYESYSLTMQNLSGSNSKLYDPYIGELDNAIQTPPQVSSNTSNYATMGILSRIQYDYDGKYFLSGSFRRDASSRFHPDNRWGNFGSAGASWLITKENFMRNLNWIDMLKLKASYGVQGNDNIGNYYAYLDQYSVTNSNGKFAVAFAYKGNKDITWETSYSFNTGADFELLNRRLNGSVEYFSRKTTDLLYNQPVPLSLGYASFPQNVGSIVNNGVEVDLNGVIFKNKNIEWTVNVNATHYKNEITALAESVKAKGAIFGSTSVFKVGGSLYNSFIRKSAGVDPVTGKALYFVDPDNGDNTTTDVYANAKQCDQGSTLAKVYGGFGTQLNAYGFDFSAQFSYQLGGKLYDGTYEALMHNGDMKGTNWHKDILGAWTPENTTSNIPRLSTLDISSQQQSSRFLVSSDYLSLNSLMLGYSLPKKLVRKIQLSSLRVYLSGDNLGLLSTRKGLDPRQSLGLGGSTSSGNFSYSALKTLTLGVSLKF